MRKNDRNQIFVLPAIALALFTFGLVACGGGGGGAGGDDASGEMVARGEKLYVQTCGTCHGKDAEGLPNLGKPLLDNEFIQEKSDAEMVEFLKKGRPATHPENTRGVDMPPKGGNPALTEEDLQAIVAYVRTLQ
ncbi:MAG: cytochrome c [Thermoanaerobaculia bacterium]|nr:cytochrome c [Thermoanaerobaculia bacterium]